MDQKEYLIFRGGKKGISFIKKPPLLGGWVGRGG